jgi:hypothetical protein
MKKHSLWILIVVLVIIASCTPATTTITCTIKNEYYHNLPSVEYTFINGKLSRMDIYDSTALYSYNIFNRDGSGNLTSVTQYWAGDSLMVDHLVYTGSNGNIDSVVVMFDTNGDAIGDQYSASYIYQYTGNDVTTIYSRTATSPVALNNTITWSGGNLAGTESAILNTTNTYTYSSVKSPFTAYRNEFMAWQLFPQYNVSVNMATLKEKRDSNNVLISTTVYEPTGDADGKLTRLIFPAFGDTVFYNYNCIEQ